MRSLKNFKIPFISLRLFIYGPNCDLKSQYAGVIGKFISKFLKNKILRFMEMEIKLEVLFMLMTL